MKKCVYNFRHYFLTSYKHLAVHNVHGNIKGLGVSNNVYFLDLDKNLFGPYRSHLLSRKSLVSS